MKSSPERDALILNVNDDEPNRYAVTRMLKHGGYQVIDASSGEEALALIASKTPALVVLDVRLPDMSGFEVCRRIKEAQPALMVLHLSAFATNTNDRVTGLEHGADGYLTLPVDARVLLATVHSLLRLQRAEVEARASSDYWQACFDAVHDGIALVGVDGRVLRCNDAFSDIFNRPMSGEPAFGPGSELEQVRRSPKAQRLEVGKDGRWYQVSVDPLRGGDGAVLVMVDVTERKVLEQVLTQRAEDLVEGDRRKDEFLAMLAHELRNPLSAVSSALELLPNAPESQRVGDVIRRQTLHVARLIDDLLDVSRIRRGRVQLKRRPMDLTALVRASVDNVRPRLQATGHALGVEVPDEALFVFGDPTRLEQVLSNLLDNACRYTPTGGRIGVRLSHEQGHALLSVTDTGDGIPKEMLEKVFELFTQLNVTIDRRRGGLGIGLTLVKNLVEMHDGSVRALSDGQGQGTTFELRIPLTAERAVEVAPKAAPPARRRALDILVVEDNEDAREMLLELLVAWGHNVVAEADGKAGLARGVAQRFDAAIIDIGLPLLDGYSLARQLKAHELSAATHLIALTGYGSSDEKGRSAQAGFALHMVKPVDVEELERVLSGLQDAARAEETA